MGSMVVDFICTFSKGSSEPSPFQCVEILELDIYCSITNSQSGVEDSRFTCTTNLTFLCHVKYYLKLANITTYSSDLKIIHSARNYQVLFAGDQSSLKLTTLTLERREMGVFNIQSLKYIILLYIIISLISMQ